jgi:putative transposase
MKTKYSEEKIVQILNEAVAGAKVLETCRKYGISDASYYNLRSKYRGMCVSGVKRLKELETDSELFY